MTLAAQCFHLATPLLRLDSLVRPTCLQYEANARFLLARMGTDTIANLQQASQLYAEAVRAFPPNSNDRADCLLNQSAVHRLLGALGVSARSNLEETIRLSTLARSIYGASTQDYGRCLLNDGNARSELAQLGIDPQSNLEDAVRLFNQARLLIGPGDKDWSLCQMNEGIAYFRLATLDVDKVNNLLHALRLYAVARPAIQSDPADLSNCLMNEANARLELAEMGVDAVLNAEEGLRLYNEAASLHPPNSVFAQKIRMNEANAHRTLAELGADSAGHFKEALRLLEHSNAEEGLIFYQCLYNAATVRLALARLGIDESENLSRAAETLRDAGDNLRRLGCYLDGIEAYKVLGSLLQSQHKWESAINVFEEAISALEEVRSVNLLLRDRQTLMERNTLLFEGAVTCCLQIGELGRAIEYVERGRSRALVDLLSDFDPKSGHLRGDHEQRYRDIRRQIEQVEAFLSSQHMKSGSQVPDEETLLAQVEKRRELSDALRMVEQKLRQADPDFFEWATPLTLGDMRSLARNLKRTLVMLWVGVDSARAFFVLQTGEIDQVALCLNDKVVRELMLGSSPFRHGDVVRGWMGTYLRYRIGEESRQAWLAKIEEILREIYGRIMEPIQKWLKEHKESRLAVIVAGGLGLLPLHAACWEENGGKHYVLEEVDLVYAPSAWVLKRCCERKRETWTPLLGVADPQSTTAPSLPFSCAEVQGIQRLLASAISAPNSNSFTYLEGNLARVDSVSELLPTHAVAHFSCHGSWDYEKPLDSSLILAGDARLTLRSLLTHQSLGRCCLVVMSACESSNGYSPSGSGEEYLGLPAGFVIAGANSVVGSLWSVPDAPTALLMMRLYTGLFAGASVSNALRNAQIWLKNLDRSTALNAFADQLGIDWTERYGDWISKLEDRPFAHPYYWAAFQVFGSPDSFVSQKEVL